MKTSEPNGPLYTANISRGAEATWKKPCACGKKTIVYCDAHHQWECAHCGKSRATGQILMLREVSAREKGDSAR